MFAVARQAAGLGTRPGGSPEPQVHHILGGEGRRTLADHSLEGGNYHSYIKLIKLWFAEGKN